VFVGFSGMFGGATKWVGENSVKSVVIGGVVVYVVVVRSEKF
jgi:hypothetical protein